MKKIILIVLLLIPMLHVRAEFSYTSYSEWKEVEVLPNLETDLLEFREEKQYKWYRSKKEGKYFKVGDHHDEYPKETDFYKYGEWSNWSNEKPVETEALELETRKIYHYQTMKKIKFIRLSEIETKDLEIINIHVYNDRKEISFKIQKENSTIVFELDEPCYADELEIDFTMVENTNDEKHFKIEWLYDFDIPQTFETYCRFWFSGSYDVSYSDESMAKKLIAWNEWQQSLEPLETDHHSRVFVEEQYRYRERLVYYEKEVKEYSDSYSAFPLKEFPYPDLETERTVFQIRTREKIEQKKENVVQTESKMMPLCSKNTILVSDDSKDLKQNLEEAKATIASLKNEKSKEIETKPCPVLTQKQSHLKCMICSLLFLLLGILIGRFMTMKKKF